MRVSHPMQPLTQSCMLTSDGGSAGCGGASLGGAGGATAVAHQGLQLKGGGAQEDDQQEVEDGGQEGASEVGGDAAVGAGARVVQHIVGVAFVLRAGTHTLVRPKPFLEG